MTIPLWKCENCGRLMLDMYPFCNKCTDKLLTKAPKPPKPLKQSDKNEIDVVRQNQIAITLKMLDDLEY